MKIYKSKIGLEFVVPIIIVFVFPVYNSIIYRQWISVIPLFLVPFLIIYFVFFKTKYIINNNKLDIAFSSIINTTIDVKLIYKISETYNIMGAPASSIDRLEIKYNKSDIVLVSPKDKQGFINSLLEINSNIEVIYRKK